jgi:hypothetical protein
MAGEHNRCNAAKTPLQCDCAVCFKPQNYDVFRCGCVRRWLWLIINQINSLDAYTR